MEIYEITKNDVGTGRFFERKSDATSQMMTLNKYAITQMCFEMHKLTGVKQGKGASEFQEFIDKVTTPPFAVRSITVKGRWD